MSKDSNYAQAKDGIYSEERLVITDDVDFNYEWTMQSILAWMQEIAESHSRIHGYSFDDLREKNLCWVCLRYHIKINRLPKLYEKVETLTWAEPSRLGVYPRMFLFKDQDDQTYLRAASAWSIIDLDNRSMINPEKYGLAPYFTRDDKSFRDLNALSRITVPEGDVKSTKYKPVFTDFDMNGHVNNTRYLLWFDNQFSVDDHKKYQMREVQIHYNHEVLPETELDLHLITADNRAYFSAVSEAGNHFQMLATVD